MPSRNIAEVTEPFFGDKLYQQRARKALPLLIRQAQALQKIYYSNLAEELNMPNPRNLDYVLGCIGRTLLKLSEEWEDDIPAIQCLVVNQSTGLPGEGIGGFIDKDGFKNYTTKEKRIAIDTHLQEIYAYQYWDDVLEALELKPALSDLSPQVRIAQKGGFGGGEGEHHKNLKEEVALYPRLVGLPKSVKKGVTEYALPSGDMIDVLFRHGSLWIAVEVKSHISNEADISRGLFQCIKYQAVLEAYLASIGEPQDVRVILYIDTTLPTALIPLRNILGIKVMQHNKNG